MEKKWKKNIHTYILMYILLNHFVVYLNPCKLYFNKNIQYKRNWKKQSRSFSQGTSPECPDDTDPSTSSFNRMYGVPTLVTGTGAIMIWPPRSLGVIGFVDARHQNRARPGGPGNGTQSWLWNAPFSSPTFLKVVLKGWQCLPTFAKCLMKKGKKKNLVSKKPPFECSLKSPFCFEKQMLPNGQNIYVWKPHNENTQ